MSEKTKFYVVKFIIAIVTGALTALCIYGGYYTMFTIHGSTQIREVLWNILGVFLFIFSLSWGLMFLGTIAFSWKNWNDPELVDPVEDKEYDSYFKD